MNLVKRSSVEGGIKSRVRAFRGVRSLIEASLLLTLNFLTRPWPISLSCFLIGLVRGLMQGLGQVQDFEAIVMEIKS